MAFSIDPVPLLMTAIREYPRLSTDWLGNRAFRIRRSAIAGPPTSYAGLTSAVKLYPMPRTVFRILGFFGSGSIFLRSLAIWLSMVRS